MASTVSPIGRYASGEPTVALALAPQRLLTCLLDWQLWYWGQDIQHAAGNTLLDYGFERVRGPADGTQRSSAYVLAADRAPVDACHGLDRMIAWGFGISAAHSAFASPQGSLLMVRHERAPGLCFSPLHAEAGTRTLLPLRVVPRNAQEWGCLCTTLGAVARCCADYEAWLRCHVGLDHRIEAHQRRPRAVRRKHEQPLYLDEAWHRLADCIDRDATADSVVTGAVS